MARFSKRRLATIGITFSVALGTGFLVQYGDAVASRWGNDAPVGGPSVANTLENLEYTPITTSVVPSVALTSPDQAVVQDAAITLDDMPTEELAPTFGTAPLDEPMAEPVQEEVVAEQNCDISLAAGSMKLAMVQLQLYAPCHASQVLAIHHEGMMFNAMTDDLGLMTVDVPVLSPDAFFIAAFDGGVGAIAQVDVEEFDMFDRVVLQWQGDSGVQLHALEFGATYGENGHLWSQAPGSFAGAMTGQNGLMNSLGDMSVLQPMLVEAYTFPSGYSSFDGNIALSVEAEVTAMNCGQTVRAQTIQVRPSQAPLVTDLSLTMPDCDAIGEYVLLKNVLEELTLASK